MLHLKPCSLPGSNFENRDYGASASPLAPPRVQGESMAALRFGAAVRMGSTPASTVIAVTVLESAPSVETIMTASPFCKSAIVLLGIRPRKRCKSGEPFPLCTPPGPRENCPCSEVFPFGVHDCAGRAA